MSDYQYYEYQTGGEQTNGQNPYNPYQKEPKPKKEKRQSSGFGKKMGRAVALGLAFGLAAGAVFTGTNYVASRYLPGNQTAAITESKTGTDGATAAQLSQSNGQLDSTAVSTAVTVTDVSDIADNVMPAIVQVTTISVVEYKNFFGQVGTYETPGAGSGIIISEDEDYVYIATNNHVVSGAKSLSVTFADDSVVDAEVLGTDPNTDLAVVRVKLSDIDSATLSEIKIATLGNSDDLRIGEATVVIGNALGYGQSVTTGVISALDREVKLEGENGQEISNELIQTDAAVNPGNSGGALLNMNGEVIGVVSAKYADTDVEGMGYAIPITQAKGIIEMLMSGQAASDETEEIAHEAYLGISGVDVTSSYAIQYNMPTGVYVAGVYTGSGAYLAGITRGDVIIAFDGAEISSMRGIQTALATKQPGDKVQITLATAESDYSQTKTVEVTLTTQDALS